MKGDSLIFALSGREAAAMAAAAAAAAVLTAAAAAAAEVVGEPAEVAVAVARAGAAAAAVAVAGAGAGAEAAALAASEAAAALAASAVAASAAAAALAASAVAAAAAEAAAAEAVAAAAEAVAASIVFTLQIFLALIATPTSCCGIWSGFRTQSKRTRGVRDLLFVLSVLLASLPIQRLHHFSHLDGLQAAGILPLSAKLFIIYPSIYLLPAHYYVTAHPSFVHWSQWKKEKWIGSGSFGQVYLASNRLCGLFCAIKEIHLDPDSKEQSEKLYWEIDLLSQFSHPNIVQYYGSNLTDGILSIYMEYMPEGSIHKLIKDGPFNENRIRHCTAQILSGLAYLHAMEIAHRDIKGGNILVGPNGEVKLADFGLAKKISYEAAIHSDKGTSFWMAPEVIKSKSSGSGYNLLADIWSLGCTVIEMSTGRHPWHEYCRPGESCNHPIAGMFRVANSEDAPRIPGSLSEEGKDFLRKCLRRDPKSRPTAAQLMDHAFVRDYFAAV